MDRKLIFLDIDMGQISSCGMTYRLPLASAAKHPDVVVLVTNSDDYENLTIQPGPCKVMEQVIQVK